LRDKKDHLWCVPGGNIDPADRNTQHPEFTAFKREYKEETGYKLPNLTIYSKFDYGLPAHTRIYVATFTEDVTIVVVLGSITYNGNVYTVGQDVFIDVSVAAFFTGTGTANIIVNTELPLYLHREIVRKAVSIQLSIIGDNNRKQTIEFDEKSS
jgi:hypothetical protein